MRGVLVSRWILSGVLILAAVEAASIRAENIDPGSDGSKYAWAENLGWINAQPNGPGGPGIQVSDTDLTGWAWSENAGWISLSCTNRSCAGGSYGVTNDGCGTLAGYAWSENAGWLNFAPMGAGVTINPKTGIFSGRAWSENAGWITFASAGPNPYHVVTAWRRVVPSGHAALKGIRSSATAALLTWDALSGATASDVVYGDLNVLRASGGNFQLATLNPIVCNTPLLSVTQDGNPAARNGFWFLERGGNCGGAGTYNDGTQVASRDPGILASGRDCPQ